MTYSEGLYPPDLSIPEEKVLATFCNSADRQKSLLFAMQCNGYFIKDSGKWDFNPTAVDNFLSEFEGQKISFYGPNAKEKETKFFSNIRLGHERFLPALSQPEVTDTISKYLRVDTNLAARIAFMLGGIVRHIGTNSNADIDKDAESTQAVGFAAHMTKYGECKSGEAIAAAMAMFIFSGGSVNEDSLFKGNVFRMSEAIQRDPVIPKETKDLGLSQVARLHTFLDPKNEPLPDIASDLEALAGFPTVGAEFHFKPDAPNTYPNFWQRTAVLNMSQYQRGCHIQLSRNDRGVIEMRMNPSVYPVAVANWNHIRLLFPELKQTFYTVTVNRNTSQDFNWESDSDKKLLNQLRAIGMLSFAGIFSEVPERGEEAEIDFGGIYLGQTVRLTDEDFQFTGFWGGNEGSNGQLGVYAGFRGNFPHLAYNLSMVLKDPSVLWGVDRDFLRRMNTLDAALKSEQRQRRHVFRAIQERVNAVSKLKHAQNSGKQIMELLYP